jgi:hypothetical protein
MQLLIDFRLLSHYKGWMHFGRWFGQVGPSLLRKLNIFELEGGRGAKLIILNTPHSSPLHGLINAT